MPDRHTSFEIGSNHHLLADNVNVRSKADPKAVVVTKLPIGSLVKIIEQGPVFSMNGLEATWYEVEFNLNGQPSKGHVWGGLIASASLPSISDPSLFFHYGISKVAEEDEGATNTLFQIRAERNGKEIARLEFDGGYASPSTGFEIVSMPPKGIKGVSEIVEISYSDGFCGGFFGEVYLVWNGAEFIFMTSTHDGVDAPYTYDEQIIFPSDEGGQAGKVIFRAYSNSEAVEQEQEDLNVEKMEEEVFYVWDGKQLVVVK